MGCAACCRSGPLDEGVAFTSGRIGGRGGYKWGQRSNTFYRLPSRLLHWRRPPRRRLTNNVRYKAPGGLF